MVPVLRLCLGLVLLPVLSAASLAQDVYPSRPVRIVVGFGPGSAADLTARVLAQRLSRTMG
jgi:tripartite-type tricarboxylate transporter receptor subunit TctC